MKTDWTEREVSLLFDAYDDYVEEQLGYKPLITRLTQAQGLNISVLDYGCGGGKVSRRLFTAGIKDVVGVDISSTMIRKAEEQLGEQGIRYFKIDSATLPFEENTFDVAVCCYVFINIHSLGELNRVAVEIYRTLKPGGALYLLDTNPTSTGVRFSSFRNGDSGVTYRNGDARPVYLDIPDQTEPFTIIDNHWEKQTYIDVLTAAGFGKIEVFEILAKDIQEEDRTRLGEAEHRWPPFLMLSASKVATGSVEY